jgi:aspartate/methionine/tyrosine aminotransferase
MWERTVTIGSAGKAFSSTGAKVSPKFLDQKSKVIESYSNFKNFKIGWTIGPKELIRLCAIVHNNSIYVCPTFFQVIQSLKKIRLK